jgi:soluble lytic murein transglycosylase
MAAAYQLLLMSPAPNSYQSPTYLQRLVYPFPYQDLIESAAQTYHVDPLLLVALVRQESCFNPRAHSSADAQGLTQIVPATAAILADHLGLADFSPADLARPRVAIQLGAAYLGGLLRQYDGDPYLAIIAYNAGSGMLSKWLADNPRHDIDLLAQEIGFKETRDYLRNVYRYYQEYQAVYRPTSWIASSGD